MLLAAKAVSIGEEMTAQAAIVNVDATVVAGEDRYTVCEHNIV